MICLLACYSASAIVLNCTERGTHIVDQDRELAVLVHVLLDDSLAVGVLHQVDLDDVALSAFLLFDLLLDLFGAGGGGVSLKAKTSGPTSEVFRVASMRRTFAELVASKAVAALPPCIMRSKDQLLTLPSPEANR
jgi:hypothetical protein